VCVSYIVDGSTVPEVIIAAYCGLNVFGLAQVTNMCVSCIVGGATVPEVIIAAHCGLKVFGLS
jgi:purine nucleoside phosphorylase